MATIAFCNTRSNLVLAFMISTGVALYGWGMFFNTLAVVANDNDMPIVLEHHGNVDVIVGDTWLNQTRSHAKFLWLADRFHYRFPDLGTIVDIRELPRMVRWWIITLKFPTDDRLRAFSVGDVMCWSGTLIFLFFLPFLIISIPATIYQNVRSGIGMRGRSA